MPVASRQALLEGDALRYVAETSDVAVRKLPDPSGPPHRVGNGLFFRCWVALLPRGACLQRNMFKGGPGRCGGAVVAGWSGRAGIKQNVCGGARPEGSRSYEAARRRRQGVSDLLRRLRRALAVEDGRVPLS